MSKSLGNYVALEDAPGETFGKLMSISDDLMVRYYELLTTEDLAKVKTAHPMQAKQHLARLLVARYHGEEAARQAHEGFQQKFQDREFPSEPDVRLSLTKSDLKRDGTISLTDLVAKTGLVPSKSEARRLIIQGGLEVNGQKQTDANAVLTLVVGQAYQMKVGRRKFALVELQG
jgi:tyrosyl-tRNA synthetase